MGASEPVKHAFVLIAASMMALTSGNFRFVFWMAVLPAFVSLALVVFAVREPAPRRADAAQPLRLADAGRLPRSFWAVVAVGTALTLARFSEAFLILRCRDVGLRVSLAPLVLVVMNVVYSIGAYPAGVLSDRLGRAGVLAGGMALLMVADVVLALAGGVIGVFAGVALWGLHMSLTQGLFATLVADTAPADLRGTAFGVYNFATGIAMLLASVIAGRLWDSYGPASTFLAGAGFTAVALVGLAFARRRARRGAADPGD